MKDNAKEMTMTIEQERKKREAVRVAGFAKLHERMRTTLGVIIEALGDAGVQVTMPKRSSTLSHDHAINIDVPGISQTVQLEASVKRGGSYSYAAPTGEEPLTFKIGMYNAVRIRSAKEDPNLCGVRLPLIVKAVVDDIANTKARNENERRRQTNRAATTKIAVRCNKLADADGTLQFSHTDSDPDRVLLEVRKILVTEEEAREITRVLVPLLVKINERNDGAIDE